MKKIYKCLLGCFMAAVLIFGTVPAYAATTVSCDEAMVVSSGTTLLLSDKSIEKDVYIAQDCELVTLGKVTITGDVYVFGTLINVGTLIVNGTINCLYFYSGGITITAGNYDFGYFTNYGGCKALLNVSSSLFSISIPELTHSWNDGVVTKKATTTKTGVKTYTCSVCGETKTESIAKASVKTGESEDEDSWTIGGSTYKVTGYSEVAMTKASTKSSSVTVPATVTINGKSYNVTSIADNAFSGNKKLTKVTIGSNVTSIGANAFAKCTKLKTVTIGKNVKKIGKKAFFKCKSLKKITIKSKKLKSVGNKAIKGIKKNAKIKVPKNKKQTYKKLFKKKTGFTKTMKLK